MTATAASAASAATAAIININISNFLFWTSIANHIDNPNLSRAQCMKNALKELKELKVEHMLRSFIRNKSREIKKKYPEYTTAHCIKVSLSEWKKQTTLYKL
jgi:hypothetical protein